MFETRLIEQFDIQSDDTSDSSSDTLAFCCRCRTRVTSAVCLLGVEVLNK